jgi:two-component system OmpR family response regulator
MSAPLHILCIDDEDDILEVVRLCLSFDGGFSISTCRSGSEALDFLDQVQPDLILLDVMMPRMDGPATLEAIRTLKAARDIPVIFMTARAQASEIDRYLKLGAIGVVPKPFDPVTLASEIRRAFGAWAGEKRLVPGAR